MRNKLPNLSGGSQEKGEGGEGPGPIAIFPEAAGGAAKKSKC